jgi:hypothetical protein
VNVLDVAEDTAGTDRSELLIITDQSDTCPAVDGEPDCRVEGQRVGHAGLINDDQRRRSHPGRPDRQLTVLEGPGEFGECVGGNAGLLAEDGSGGSGRGSGNH